MFFPSREFFPSGRLRFLARSFSGIAAVGVAALWLSACGQDLGERCEQNSDCKSGSCSVMSGPTSAMGGVCEDGTQTGSSSDASTSDAAVDAPADTRDATDADAAAPDALDGATDGTLDASDASSDVSTDVSSDGDSDGATDTSADVSTDGGADLSSGG
jgi:phage-related tail fiber protein